MKGWRSAGPFLCAIVNKQPDKQPTASGHNLSKHTHVENYTRIVHTSGVQVTYVCVMRTLKPNGISHSVVPDKPMTYNQWMQYIHAQNQST